MMCSLVNTHGYTTQLQFKYPLVMTNIAMENHHAITGKTHSIYIYIWPFSIAMYYQRVYLEKESSEIMHWNEGRPTLPGNTLPTSYVSFGAAKIALENGN